jgi:hypothetical protein
MLCCCALQPLYSSSCSNDGTRYAAAAIVQRSIAPLLWQLPFNLLATPLPTSQGKLPLPVDLLTAAAHALAKQSGSSSNATQQQQQQPAMSPASSSRPTSSSRRASAQQQQQQRLGAVGGGDVTGKPGWQVLAELLLQLLQVLPLAAATPAGLKASPDAQPRSNGALAVCGAAEAAAAASRTAVAAAVGRWDQLQQQLLANLVQCCSGE